MRRLHAKRSRLVTAALVLMLGFGMVGAKDCDCDCAYAPHPAASTPQ